MLPDYFLVCYANETMPRKRARSRSISSLAEGESTSRYQTNDMFFPEPQKVTKPLTRSVMKAGVAPEKKRKLAQTAIKIPVAESTVRATKNNA